MKIGFFLPNATFDLPGTAEVGGIEVFALTVGEALQRMGHEVILYGGRPKSGRSHVKTSLNLRLYDYIETRSVPDIGTRFQRLVQRLHFGWVTYGDVLDDNLDAIILSKPFDWPVAWCWKRKPPGMRVVMGFHGEDYYAGDRHFYGAVDAAFAVSKRVAELAQKRIGCMPDLIPNPADCHFYQPVEMIAGKQNIPLLGATGRLVGWKGFHILIEAVGRLHAEGFPVRCELAGDGPERERLEREVVERGLSAFFHLPGSLPRERIKDLLQRADAYVLPSIGFESFSIAALEAASMGLPLVLSDQVALAEVLEPQDCLVFKHGDVADLCRSVRQTLEVPLDTGLRKARHNRIAADFSPEKVAQRLLQLIEDKTG